MSMNEKVAYLEGFIEGLDLDKDSKEGRAIFAILDVLEDMADEQEEIKDDIEELEDFSEELDEDLGELEEFIFLDECDCEFCDDEDDDDEFTMGELIYDPDEEDEEEEEKECDCGCGHHHE